LADKVYVLGSGGHAHTVAESLSDCRHRQENGQPLQFIFIKKDDGETHASDRVIQEKELKTLQEPIQLFNGIGANPHLSPRRSIFEAYYGQQNISFPTLIHPDASVASSAIIADGVQILRQVSIGSDVTIGENALIYSRSVVEHGSEIGNHCFIGPGAILCGDVQLAHSVFIGAGAIVLPGVEIGEGAIIGAGVTVRQSVPPSDIVRI